MMYFNRFFFLLILLFAIRFLCFPTNNHTLKSITENERQRVNSFFTENKGQVGFYGPNENINILFYSQTRGLNYYITSKGISYCFFNVKDEPREKFLKIRKLFKREPQNEELENKEVQYARIDMDLEGANIDSKNIIAENPSEFIQNYYYPHCPNGVTNVKSFQKLIIKNVYPHIDWVIYNKTNQGFKYDFIVHPGGNASDIKLKYNWAKLNLFSDGSLNIKTKLGSIKESAPIVFQGNQNISCTYQFINNNTIAYSLSSYNQNKDLIIDPNLNLFWGTYYGANTSYDGFKSVCSDAADNLYVTGYSSSSNFPTLNMGGGSYFTGTYAGSSAGDGNDDVVVLKFDAMGVRLWATYYGGSGWEQGFSCKIDGNNKLYITGRTGSSNLPTNTLTGAYNDNTLGGTFDIFMLRFTTAGVREWATYVGGTGNDYATYMDIDGSNNVYVVGYIDGSTSFPFLNPGGGAYNDNTIGTATYKAVILKFNSSAAQVWATAYGGTSDTRGYGITLDGSNNVYITGSTTATDLPTLTLTGAYNKSTNTGSSDAFLVKFNSSSVRQWATYFGGTGNDYGYRVGVDGAGQIYIFGETSSTASFPVINPGGGAYYSATNAGAPDAFIAQFTSAGAQRWCTYYGGSAAEMWGAYNASSIDFDSGNNVYIASSTYSTNFPVLSYSGGGFYQSANSGSAEDCVLMCFSNTGTQLWSTYVGTPSGYDFGTSCIITPAGYLVTVGEWPNSSSNGLQDPGGGAYYSSSWSGAGGDDSYIMKFNSILVLPIELGYFKTTCTKNGVEIKWQALSQTNNKAFIVERSSDAINFKEITSIPGERNTTQPKEYTYLDEEIVAGMYYYRLKQVDFNNAEKTFSAYVSNCFINTENTLLYPNPATNLIVVQLKNSLNLPSNEYTITNILGQTVLTGQISNDVNPIDISPLPEGVYYLKINDNSLLSAKFIKVNKSIP